MKLLFLILGLAVGFGGGVWWGVRNPAQAADLAAKQEQWVLEGKIQATEAIKAKLDRLIAREKADTAKRTGGGSGFVSGRTGAAASGDGPDPELLSLREESDRQLAELRKQLDQKK